MKKIISGISALVLLLCCAISAHAQNIKFTEFDLDNGLHVILHQNKRAPIVAVSVLYHVGSKNEDPERTGFAHFFEHLLFEGSKNIARGEFDKYIKNAGGAANANTTQDRTFYYEILPSNQLELGLWLESERMLHAKVEKIGVETQREVVKEEKRQRIDNQPYGTFMQNVFSRAFTKHPYTWQPIGSMDHLNAAQLDEFMAFYKKFYVPNNATLSIAGDINVKEAKALVEKYFKDIPRGADVPKVNVVEPPLGGEKRATVEDNIQLPAVVQAYRMPKQGHEDYYAMQMLSRVLAGGSSARFQKEIVDKKQTALQAMTFAYGLEDAGLFIAFGLCNFGKEIEVLEKDIQTELDRVKNELVSENEFEKIKNQTENDFYGDNSMANVAENLANYHVYYGDANLINTEVERYLKVTREDLQRVAKKYLNKDNRVVLHYVPKK